jgi:hypothetical protein
MEVCGLSHGRPGPLALLLPRDDRRRREVHLVLNDGTVVAASDLQLQATNDATAYVLGNGWRAEYVAADGRVGLRSLSVPHALTVVLRYRFEGPGELVIARWKDEGEICVGIFAAEDLTTDANIGLTAGCRIGRHSVARSGNSHYRYIWWERFATWGACTNCGGRQMTVTWARRRSLRLPA